MMHGQIFSLAGPLAGHMARNIDNNAKSSVFALFVLFDLFTHLPIH